MNLSKEEIIKGLVALDIKPGDSLIVHSSLSSFGIVSGGAKTVIDSLKEAVTPTGNILMPAFTYGKDTYDRYRTPSQTGSITEEFRKTPYTLRTNHPTHSMCVWGSQAIDLINTNDSVGADDQENTFGVNSLFSCLKDSSYVLLIGVNFDACSLMHYGQNLTSVSYLKRIKTVNRIKENGETESVLVRRAGCSRGFNKIEAKLDSKEIFSGKIGNSLVKKIKTKTIISETIKALYEDEGYFFCDNTDCFSCNEARTLVSRV